jgi:hypothetical protein
MKNKILHTLIPVSIFCFLFNFTSLFSQPANDNCSGAISIIPQTSSSTCVSSTTVTTVGATNSGIVVCNGDASVKDVWYSFVATATRQIIRFSNAPTSDYLGMSLYTDCSGSGVNTCSAYNVTSTGNIVKTTNTLVVGQTYYLQVWLSSSQGTFNLCIQNPPAYDECSGGIVLTPQPFGSVCSPGTQVDMTFVTLSNSDCNPDRSPYNTQYSDVWFSFVAGATNTGIQFENVPYVSDIPSKAIGVVLYTDCNGNGMSNCKDVVLNPEVDGKYLFVATNLTIGTTYYLKASFFRSRPLFNICILNMPPITNDACSGAIALPTPQPYSAGCVSSVSAHTFGATRSNSTCDFNSNDDDVWFSFVATATTQHVQLLNILEINGGYASHMDIGLYDVDDCSSLPRTCLYPLRITNGRIEAIFSCLTIGNTYYLKVNTTATYGRARFDICIKNPPPPPSNDLCTNPVVLTPQPYSSACSASFAATLVGATTSDCGTSGDIWFSFVAGTAEETFIFENITAVVGPKNSLFVTIYSDCNGSFIIAGAAPVYNINNTSSSVALDGMTPGTTYLLKIHTMVGTSSTFNICIVNRPTNDDCTTAQVLTVQSNLTCSTPTGGTTRHATQSSSITPCYGTADDDVWFSFVATACAHTITVAPFGTFQIYNPVIELKEGTCSGTSLYCVNATGNYGTEVINASNLVIGRTYFVRVWDFGSVGINFAGRGSFTICVTTPSIMTYTSSTTTQNTATVAAGSVGSNILRLDINTTGSGCPLSISQIRANINGTTTPTNINFASIYYTATSNVFNSSTATLFGTAIVRPNTGTLQFNGSQVLTGITGSTTNYFWLVYDVSACANLSNVLDGEIVDFTIANNLTVPSTTAPAGVRTITSQQANYTALYNGNWSSSSTWGGCAPTSSTTFMNIASNVVVDGSYTYNATTIVNILPTATLTINSGNSLTFGPTGGGYSAILVLGGLQIGGGTLNVNGQLAFGNAGNFNMTSGNINIDGNSGSSATSLGYDIAPFYLLDNLSQLTVNCSGGTITIVDPTFNPPPWYDNYVAPSVLIQANANNPNAFSLAGSTMRFGDGISTQTGYGPFRFVTYGNTKNVPLGNVIVNGGSTTNRHATGTSDGANIYGTLTINSGSEFRSTGGHLGICGDIINNGIMTMNYWGLYLGGIRTGGAPVCNTPQSLSGTGIWRNNVTTPTASIDYLTMNNPLGITLNFPLSVIGLDLTSGNIRTSSTNYLAVGGGILPVGTLSSGQISGGSNTSKIIGPVKIPSLSSSRRLPLGDATTYHPVNNISFSTSPTTHGVWTAQYKTGSPSYSGLPFTDGGQSIEGISPTGYWDISKDAALTGGIYTIYLDASGFKKSNGDPITDLSSIRLIKRPSGGNWTATDCSPGSPYSLSQMYRENCTSFSEFAIGGRMTDFVLPIELVSFNAKITEGGKTQLNWQTASELNVKNFDIEKSLNSKNFEKIAEIKANNTPSVYSAFDEHFSTSAYYRLKINDLNGASNYSKTVFLEKGDIKTLNIIRDTEGSVLIETNDKIELITVTNTIGQLIKSTKNKRFLINELNSGIYIISVKTDKGFLSKKVFKN